MCCMYNVWCVCSCFSGGRVFWGGAICFSVVICVYGAVFVECWLVCAERIFLGIWWIILCLLDLLRGGYLSCLLGYELPWRILDLIHLYRTVSQYNIHNKWIFVCFVDFNLFLWFDLCLGFCFFWGFYWRGCSELFNKVCVICICILVESVCGVLKGLLFLFFFWVFLC